MLRNVTKLGMKFCFLRNNQAWIPFIVTIINNNSVLSVPYLDFQKSPATSSKAYLNVNSLWKTIKPPVEIVWNQ